MDAVVRAGEAGFELVLPLRLVSEANSRSGSWHAGAARAKQQRGVARLATALALPWRRPLVGSFAIRITRVGVRTLDSDNLARAAKAVRDGIADALGIDDGSPRLSWLYAQRSGETVYAVEILIARRPPPAADLLNAADKITGRKPRRTA